MQFYYAADATIMYNISNIITGTLIRVPGQGYQVLHLTGLHVG